MTDVHALIDRLAAALARTSWRIELGPEDPAVLARAEARVGALPPDYRAFLSRVRALENHTGDVVFFSAKDHGDEDADLPRLLGEWRRADEEGARRDASALADVHSFWERALPVLCSTVNGDDFLAIDRANNGTVIEAWGEQGWSEGARPVATSFAHFLEALVAVAESGTAALECGWRLGRKTIQRLHTMDASYREPLVPIFFSTDFDSAAPPRRPTRPHAVIRR